MRREHFEQLRPTCPTCRAAGREALPLRVGTIVCSEADDILEGVLLCSERMCRREHPIIDGIPVVVADFRSWATHQLDAVVRRDDLSAFMDSLLGDAAGPGSVFDGDRTTLSAYGRVHWGDVDPETPLPRDAGLLQLLELALTLLDSPPHGIWVDLGCSVGRASVEIARRTDGLSIGVDLSFSALRVAERIRRFGRAVFPLRRVGTVFDRCDFAVSNVPSGRLSFWCCDVASLPFDDGLFDGALSLNVLDCVPSPLGHLVEMGRVLRPGAASLLSAPYDWTPAATPLEQWLGGHSQRSEASGSSAAELRRVLDSVDTGIRIKAERDRIPWRVYVHERASMEYAVHVLRIDREQASQTHADFRS